MKYASYMREKKAWKQAWNMNTPSSTEDQSFQDFESTIMEIQGRLQFKLITRIYFGCDSEQLEVRNLAVLTG